MNKEIIKIIALAILYDCVILGCFTLLAIIFRHWWIVLFSMIFWKNFTYGKSDEKK